MCTSDRCGSAACMRRLAGSWINSDDQCAASATTTKEGTTGKCYPSPEYNLLPITWTVQRTNLSLPRPEYRIRALQITNPEIVKCRRDLGVGTAADPKHWPSDGTQSDC